MQIIGRPKTRTIEESKKRENFINKFIYFQLIFNIRKWLLFLILSFHRNFIPRNRFHFGDVNFCL